MLSSEPTLLMGQSGNVLPYQTLQNYPNSPSSVIFICDVSNSLGAYLQLWTIGGAAVNSTTNGIYYQAFSTSDGQNYDTSPYYIPYLLPVVANSNQRQSFLLSTGKYQIQLINTDPNNAVATMASTGNLV